MIRIFLIDGETIKYRRDEYTDYIYDGKYFVVINHCQWIGLYNLDLIKYIKIDTANRSYDNGKEQRQTRKEN